MEKLKMEIQRIKRHRLDYYKSHLDLIEDHIEEKPDISIETCKALIEGISKLSLHLLKQEPIIAKPEDLSPLIKRALSALQEGRGFSDVETCRRFAGIVHYIGEVRNANCDIGHGRPSLKEQVNDADFAELIIGITDSICTYMLRRLDSLVEKPLEYEDNPEFNALLDEQYQLPGRILYSRALFNQEFETYEIELADFLLESDPEE
jgi:Abortive infection C-terminus